MNLIGNCQTTSMEILPHTSVEDALNLSLSLDIPFWPQLPRMSFYEDMYVQITEQMPGIIIDYNKEKISFSKSKFYEDLPEYSEYMENLHYFRLSPRYSLTYNAFLEKELSQYHAVRGQVIGPISFGLEIIDENFKPVIYDDEVREFLYEYISKRINAQYQELKKYNDRAFVWIDEPHLAMIFNANIGYASESAKVEYTDFLKTLPCPKAVHLCSNPDWSFLFKIDLDIISLDALSWGKVFTYYTEEIKEFLDRGGIICWGIAPTVDEQVKRSTDSEMLAKLEELWSFLAARGIPKEQLLEQAWLAPDHCFFLNPTLSNLEKSFAMLRKMSQRLKEKYKLYHS